MRQVALAPQLAQVQSPGDGMAPPGSLPWAQYVRGKLRGDLSDSRSRILFIQSTLRGFEEYQAYEQLLDQYGTPFSSMARFALERQPFGLGFKPDAYDALMRETRNLLLQEFHEEIDAARQDPLASHGGDREYDSARHQPLAEHGEDHTQDGAEQGYNITLPSQRGTRKTYLLRRLARDAPDILDALDSGHYRSVHHAAIAAGIVRELTRFDLLVRQWRLASEGQKHQFVRQYLEEFTRIIVDESVVEDLTTDNLEQFSVDSGEVDSGEVSLPAN